jgi:GDP-4-dehydro-6-deoxy-D-mannose reductase
MPRVLVTGADGFVGRHLMVELGDGAVAASADVTDAAAVRDEVAVVRPDAVVHLAALSSVAASWGSSSAVWRVNALGTVHVLEAVRHEVPDARILFVSTAEVYGAEADRAPEDRPAAPVSPYAASKAAAEVACAQAVRASGLDVVVARPYAHVGPGQDERFAVGSWTRQIARLERDGGGALLVGDLSAERDLTDVRDVCRAYRLLLDPGVPAGTYNVASGDVVGLGDVVERLVALARVPVRVEQDPARLRPSDLPRLAGDAARLRAATGWVPMIALDTTLADALEAARGGLAEESG